jgi:hypothetical protein
MSDEWITVEDSWRIVDRWWTDEPQERFFLSLRAPNGETIAVSWDKENRWMMHGDPRPKIDVAE